MSIPIRDRSQVWFLIKKSFGFSPRVNLHSLFLSTFSIATFSTLYPSTTSIRHISPTVGPPSVQVHSNGLIDVSFPWSVFLENSLKRGRCYWFVARGSIRHFLPLSFIAIIFVPLLGGLSSETLFTINASDCCS